MKSSSGWLSHFFLVPSHTATRSALRSTTRCTRSLLLVVASRSTSIGVRRELSVWFDANTSRALKYSDGMK